MSAYDSYASTLDPTPKIRKRSGPFGTETLKTVAEALAFCERNGLDPAGVRLAHNYVLWESEETTEEVQARIESARSSQQKHLAWVRNTYNEYADRGLYAEEN